MLASVCTAVGVGLYASEAEATVLLQEALVRSLSDVSPALQNATSTALGEAQAIVYSYTDAIISIGIPLGAAATFFGYFLLGPVLFSTAFLLGGGGCFIAARAAIDKPELSAWISVVAMLIGGGFCGFTAVKLLSVGMFAMGAMLGVAISAALKAVLWSRIFPASPETGFIIGSCILGATCGVISLSVRKQMLILSTAYTGSFGMFFGIGHFAGHFPTLEQLNQVETGALDPWAIFYIAMAVLFGTAGMLLQLRMTRGKVMPTESPYSRHKRHRKMGGGSRDSSLLDAGREWEREVLVGKSVSAERAMESKSRSGASAEDSKYPFEDWVASVDRPEPTPIERQAKAENRRKDHDAASATTSRISLTDKANFA